MRRWVWSWVFITSFLGVGLYASWQVYGQNPPNQSVRVTAVNSQYKTITGNYAGTLATGQNASILLAGIDFNNAGGPLLFNHPGGIASDGTRLLLADRNNNRVLIWNALPTGNTPPDLVLGQANFTTNDPGKGRAQMNWPVSVKTDGRRIVVADAYNDRLLIWNSFPTQNGQAADLEIKLNDLRWPWGLWTDGTRLVATGTGSQRTLVWNQFPTRDNQPQSLTLRAGGQMGTPRTITSNGQNLIVGDHNSRAAVAPSSGPGNFVWKTFPTSEDQAPDFFISDHLSANAAWLQGDFTRDGKLVMIGRSLYIWNELMTGASDQPDVTVSGFNFEGGDGSDAIVVNGKVFISLYNGNKILVYNAPPTSANQPPDFAIGSPNVTTNTLATNFMLNNPFPATDGRSLWASSDFERRMYVWKSLPDQSGAAPDFVYDLPEGPWDNEVWGNRLALAGKRSVYLWSSLPRNGELPDVTLTNQIGGVQLQELLGVAMDDKYFYLADGQADKVYVWTGIPNQNTPPTFTLTGIRRPTRLSSDGAYLAVTGTESVPGGAIFLYRIADLSNTAQPVQVGGSNTGIQFNLPGASIVARGGLFVGDTNNSRVQIWSKIEDAIARKTPDIILGEKDLNDFTPEIGRDKLFWPSGLAFDGSHLWVGEFKFSHRLVRYSVGNAVAPNSATTVSAASFQGSELASESIAALFGTQLATGTNAATGLPLPTSLAGTRVGVTDSAGVERAASVFFVSPTQINFLVPAGSAPGTTMLNITSGNGMISRATTTLARVAPGLFAANASGQGPAAAVVLRVKADGSQTFETSARFDAAQNRFVSVPIDVSNEAEQVFVLLFGTGLRQRSALSAVQVTAGGQALDVSFAGAAPDLAGLDQINARLPRSMTGRGDVEIVLTVDGKAANRVRLNLK